MQINALVYELLTKLYRLRVHLGSSFTTPGKPSDDGKQQTRFESDGYELLKKRLMRTPGIQLTVEGYQPVTGPGSLKYQLFVDTMDGTSNTCRWNDSDAREIGESVTTVISAAPARTHLHFGDIEVGAGLDLRNGQIWIARRGKGAFTFRYGVRGGDGLIGKRNYHKHSPLIACEFYRHSNWVARLLLNQCVEWADTASSFMNILRVPLGETDLFINNPFPEISDEGQRGHELGAIMPFLSEIQGIAVSAKSGDHIEELPFTFDGMTPVMVAVDVETLDYYDKIMKDALRKPLLLPGGVKLTSAQLIRVLNDHIGRQRWRKRELP